MAMLETSNAFLSTPENQQLLATAGWIGALVDNIFELHEHHALLVPKEQGAATLALSFEGQRSAYDRTFVSLGKTSTGGRVISVTASLPDRHPDHKGDIHEFGVACYPDTDSDAAS